MVRGAGVTGSLLCRRADRARGCQERSWTTTRPHRPTARRCAAVPTLRTSRRGPSGRAPSSIPCREP
ncbi:hypothetical protein RAJCM14343_4916 [Rhodococcus aetherivorans]|uniref:Uncharacterized protein n=1 Tax=Rhodococcus aetherivorans TaxID=191292 RepID=A0ABQ0YSU8_9NOCA|nr:hypothetical protein RAJCM14343_4916 [Rhodococcus aetherivorans]